MAILSIPALIVVVVFHELEDEKDEIWFLWLIVLGLVTHGLIWQSLNHLVNEMDSCPREINEDYRLVRS